MPTARDATAHLADLLRREHVALADFLVALSAFHRDRRWVEMGYSSLFSFLVRDLGLSKGAAFYRNRAAELIEKFPVVVAPLRDGRLCLSSVAALSDVLTPENMHEVLPRYFHLSRAEAKEASAALKPHPAPPLRTIVTDVPRTVVPAAPPDGRSFPSPGSPGHPLPQAQRVDAVAAQAGFLENLVRASSAVPDVVPSSALPRPSTHVEPLTAELRRVHVTVSRTLLAKLSAARDALSHSHPSATDAELLELGLDLLIERHLKRRGIGARPRRRTRAGAASATAPAAASAGASASACVTGPVVTSAAAPASACVTGPAAASAAAPTSACVTGPVVPSAAAPASASATGSATSAPRVPASRSRHVPADVARTVWERDGGCCTWKLDNGEVCGSTCRVEIDHVEGWARGAGMQPGELRLLCRFHQDIHARALYGDDLMNRFTRPKAPRCSEPIAVYARRTGSVRAADDAVAGAGEERGVGCAVGEDDGGTVLFPLAERSRSSAPGSGGGRRVGGPRRRPAAPRSRPASRAATAAPPRARATRGRECLCRGRTHPSDGQRRAETNCGLPCCRPRDFSSTPRRHAPPPRRTSAPTPLVPVLPDGRGRTSSRAASPSHGCSGPSGCPRPSTAGSPAASARRSAEVGAPDAAGAVAGAK